MTSRLCTLASCLILGACAAQPAPSPVVVPVAKPTPPAIQSFTQAPVSFAATGSICLDTANLKNLLLNINNMNEYSAEQQAVISYYQTYLGGIDAK